MKRWGAFLLATLWLSASSLAATGGDGGAKYLRVASRADLLAGTLDGIGVDGLGRLLLAARAEKLAELSEPFLFSLASHPAGWVAGTGNSGSVVLIRRDGSLETLFSTEEPEVFAVWADDDGTVFAGSSPGGKVYRFAGGELEVHFDPEETYIWDLDSTAAGELLVATGGDGRLYRVSARGESELLYDTGDVHLRVIRRLASGDLLLGTAGEGLILRLDPKSRRARTLYDSVYPEVVAFGEGADGVAYGAVVASEASQIDLASRISAKKNGEDGNGGEGGQTGVSVSVGSPNGFSGSRPSGFGGARSALIRLAANGAVDTVWEFDEETVYALDWLHGRLWAATGLDGKLYSLRDGQMLLEQDVEEKQIVALAAGGEGPVFATTNGAAVYRVTREPEARGLYTSRVLDAAQVSSFGNLSWRGSKPAGSEVRFAVRSGMSAEPDETWSSWSTAVAADEVGLTQAPAGRYLQWRAELEPGADGSPVVSEVTVSYRQHNLAPRVESLEVLPPGEIRVPANFNPGNQVFEPTAPDKSGIFTTLGAASGQESRAQKTLWKKGYRTLSWQAEDPNGDSLEFDLEFRRRGPDARWLPLAEELAESSLSFDATVLPDGEYRFRLTVRDRTGTARDRALTAERITEPVVIDHSPPRLQVVERRGDRLRVRLLDEWSPVQQVDLAVDAERWRSVVSVDGLLDARQEQLEVEMPEDARSVLLRVMDASFNVTTFDLLREGS